MSKRAFLLLEEMESRQGEAANKKEEQKDERRYENIGLTTSESLEILQRDVKRIIEEYEKECKKSK